MGCSASVCYRLAADARQRALDADDLYAPMAWLGVANLWCEVAELEVATEAKEPLSRTECCTQGSVSNLW
jgi:hypothetical protein